LAFQEFDDAGRMKPSSYEDCIVDVMEELVRFTILLRPHAAVRNPHIYLNLKDNTSLA